MNKAETDKIKAELERNRAIQETKEIRQRYIDIMSNSNICHKSHIITQVGL